MQEADRLRALEAEAEERAAMEKAQASATPPPPPPMTEEQQAAAAEVGPHVRMMHGGLSCEQNLPTRAGLGVNV